MGPSPAFSAVKHQDLQIGQPLKVVAYWYDNITGKLVAYDGEIIGWRTSQVIVRVTNYAVVRFWKKNGLEVGNGDHARRGFRLDLSELASSVVKPEDGPGVPVAINIPVDTDA